MTLKSGIETIDFYLSGWRNLYLEVKSEDKKKEYKHLINTFEHVKNNLVIDKKSGLSIIDFYLSNWAETLHAMNILTEDLKPIWRIKELEYQIKLLTYIKEELLASKKDSYKN